MTMTHAFRRIVCRAMMGILLFAQLAVASYACPALSSAKNATPEMTVMLLQSGMSANDADSGQAMASSAGRMMECDPMSGLDPAAANLCFEHCHNGQQSDQTQVPTVPAVLLTSFLIVPRMPLVALPVRPNAASAEHLAAAFPPHAILHCCFRI